MEGGRKEVESEVRERRKGEEDSKEEKGGGIDVYSIVRTTAETGKLKSSSRIHSFPQSCGNVIVLWGDLLNCNQLCDFGHVTETLHLQRE